MVNLKSSLNFLANSMAASVLFDIKIGGTGNGENYREIKSIAIHDPEGISYLMINETKTEINDKYKYFTDVIHFESRQWKYSKCKGAG